MEVFYAKSIYIWINEFSSSGIHSILGWVIIDNGVFIDASH